MCDTKADRILATLDVRKITGYVKDEPEVDETKAIVITSADLVPILNKEMEGMQLTGKLVIAFNVNLTAKAKAKREKNDLFEIDVKKMGDILIAEVVTNMKGVCKSFDKSPVNPDIDFGKVLTIFTEQCRFWGKFLSLRLNDKINVYMESNKAIKKAYRKYQISCVHDVAADCIMIAVSIAGTAASWGAAGPVAVVAIVRSTVGLIQKCAYMAIEAGTLADIIDTYFNSLAVLLTAIAEDDKHPNPKIAWNTVKEIGLGAAAGILNIDVPSVSVVGGQMKTLESKLKGMHTTRLKFGEKMAELRQRIEAYKKKVMEEKDHMDEEEIRKHFAAIEKFGLDRMKISADAETIFESIQKLLDRQADFEEQLTAYKAGQAKWGRHSKTVFGFATSLGLGVGSAGGAAIESVVSGVNECLTTAERLLMDKVLQH